MNSNLRKKVTLAELLALIRIVYGGIGISPLYVMKTIVNENGGIAHVNRECIVGPISFILWTITLLTTVRYVLIVLKATNHGEDGIFSLYALVRKKAKWLVVPALVGGAVLLANGTLTPAVTVTTTIEGLKNMKFGNDIPTPSQNSVIMITIIILLFLFSIQRMGTNVIGKTFGPIILAWFTFLGLTGIMNLSHNWSLLETLSPLLAIEILFSPASKVGVLILGAVFLATTGAEALCPDVGHVDKGNIMDSWPYVLIYLALNYLGQGVWILEDPNYHVDATDFSPFFEALPGQWKFFAIILAVLVAIIASQILIADSFTLISGVNGLKFLPRMRVIYPSAEQGQLFIPSIDKMLCTVTVGIVFLFRTSKYMGTAYGLATTIAMLMTIVLFSECPSLRKVNFSLRLIFLLLFGAIEAMFLVSSLAKSLHGGYVTVTVAAFIGAIIYAWYFGNKVRDKREAEDAYIRLDGYATMLSSLSRDESIPLYVTDLVYMAKVKYNKFIKRDMLYSILDERPKRAHAYWSVTVNVTNKPFTTEYAVNTYGTKNVINVQLYLGFKQQQKINVYLRQIIHDLVRDGAIGSQPQEYTTTPGRNVGDFKFVIVNDITNPQTQPSSYEGWLAESQVWLQNLSSNPIVWFGLEYADMVIERIPLTLGSQDIKSTHGTKLR